MADETEIKESLNRILFYLENDSKTGKKGLVTEVADLKVELGNLKGDFSKFMNEYKVDKAVKNAKIGIIATIGGGAAIFIEWVLRVLHF